MAFEALRRFRRWSKKVDPNTTARYIELSKPLAEPEILGYQFEHEKLISLVKDVVSRLGENASRIHAYVWYAQGLWYAKKRFSGKALQINVDANYIYWRVMGLDGEVLRAIARAMGLTVSSDEEIARRLGIIVYVGEAVPTTYAYDSGSKAVVSTYEQLLAEARTAKALLDPRAVIVSASNPSGSGVSLFIKLTLAYDDNTETTWRTITVPEGASETMRFMSEDIYEDIAGGKHVVAVRLYAYVSAPPAQGYEPQVQLIVKGYEI